MTALEIELEQEFRLSNDIKTTMWAYISSYWWGSQKSHISQNPKRTRALLKRWPLFWNVNIILYHNVILLFLHFQINMYLLSRIIFGFVRLAVKKNIISEPKKDPFPFYAAVVWAVVMWQFEIFQDVLQPSLQNSMTYLYHDSNVWHSLKDFLIYNK